MSIDWDSVTRFFQIPLGWFRDVDRRSKIIPDGQGLNVDANSPDGTVLSLNIEWLDGRFAAADHTHSEYVTSADLANYVTSADLEDYVKSEDLEDYVKSEDLDDYAEWATNATKTNSLVGTDASGNLKRAVALPTTTQTYDRVLRIAANGTTLAWVNQNAVGKATDPGTNVDALTPSTSTSAADATTWTAGGTNGVTVRVQTRTRWNGTTLYGFYRDFTYDRYGRLYSVSAETRYTIDTPTTVTWS